MADRGRAQRSSGNGGAGKAKAKRRTKQDARAQYGAKAGDNADGGVASRVSLYDEVTAKIIAQLEAGCFPWAQPWNSAAAVPGLPRNAVSGRAYSGVNVLILWGAVIEG